MVASSASSSSVALPAPRGGPAAATLVLVVVVVVLAVAVVSGGLHSFHRRRPLSFSFSLHFLFLLFRGLGHHSSGALLAVSSACRGDQGGQSVDSRADAGEEPVPAERGDDGGLLQRRRRGRAAAASCRVLLPLFPVRRLRGRLCRRGVVRMGRRSIRTSGGPPRRGALDDLRDGEARGADAGRGQDGPAGRRRRRRRPGARGEEPRGLAEPEAQRARRRDGRGGGRSIGVGGFVAVVLGSRSRRKSFCGGGGGDGFAVAADLDDVLSFLAAAAAAALKASTEAASAASLEPARGPPPRAQARHDPPLPQHLGPGVSAQVRPLRVGVEAPGGGGSDEDGEDLSLLHL